MPSWPSHQALRIVLAFTFVLSSSFSINAWTLQSSGARNLELWLTLPVRNLWSLEPGECIGAEELLKKLRRALNLSNSARAP
jgi:hypothetical protein